MKHRLIAGTINKYHPEEGWQNWHLDLSGRGIWDAVAGESVQPEFQVDMAEMLGVPTGFFDEVRCHHALEHLHRSRAPLAVREFHRVLRVEGVLDIQVPDMRKLAQALFERQAPDEALLAVIFGEDCRSWSDPEMQVHHWGYTQESLQALLESVGFRVVEILYEDLRIRAAKEG